MTPIEVFAKDNLKLNILSALLDGSAEMTVYLESGCRDVPFAEVRAVAGVPGAPYRHNNFSVREEGGSVIFCPVVVGCLAVFTVTIPSQLAGAACLEIFRRGEETPAHSFPLGTGKNRFALSPVDMKKYAMRAETAGGSAKNEPSSEPSPSPSVSTSTPSSASVPGQRREALLLENAASQSDVVLLERELAELEARKNGLADRKKTLKKNIEWLTAHVEGEEVRELEELKSILEVDEEILSCYLGQGSGAQNIADVEKLLADVKAGVEKLEEQIRLFVRARQKKTLNIEAGVTGRRTAL